MSAAAVSLSALALLLAAPDAPATGPPQSPKAAYEEALEAARKATEAGDVDLANEAWELAWRRSIDAWMGSAFGTQKMTIPIGDLGKRDFRTTTLELPAGSDVQDHVAEEAALAMGRLGRRDRAVGWALRVQARVNLGVGTADLTSGQREVVEKLRLAAVAATRPDDAVHYAKLLDKDEADRQARWAAQAADRDRFRQIAAALTLAVLAFAAYWLSKLARVVAATRREQTPQRIADDVAFTGVTILKREPDGHPFRWRSSTFDLINRLALTTVLWSTVPLALFGAVAFWRLGWDHARPDKAWETALIMGLADLFAAFACFMTLMQLGTPPSAVRRQVELEAEGLVVRTVRGVFFTRAVEETFPYSSIRGLRVFEHVERQQHVTIRLFLAIVELPGRSIVLGGTGKPERSRELLESLAENTGLRIGG